jgi:hypothetical protein
MMVSHNTNIARKGMGIELAACVNGSKRVRAPSVLICSARALMERWVSFCGDSSWIAA